MARVGEIPMVAFRFRLFACVTAFAGVLSLTLPAVISTATAQQSTKSPTKAAKPGDLPPEVASVFEQNGLRIVGTNLVLEQETEVNKAIKDLAKDKKALMLADRERYAAEAELETVKLQISELRKRHTLLSAQLANVTDAITNNRLVGELNKTSGLVDVLGEQQEKSAEKAKTARGKVNDIREEFVQTLLSMRQTVDSVHQKWEALAADKSVTEAVASAATITGKKLAVKPSASFVSAEKQLKIYEEAVISETLALENERGNFWVNVAINGKPVEKMVVDSGATTISISTDMAKKLGIELKSTDPDITVGLADGRRIPAKLTRLETVRVGKFTADNVECVVLGEEATEAPPLLGMSFLGQFKFELDAAQSQLKMVKVDSGEPAPSTKVKKKKTK